MGLSFWRCTVRVGRGLSFVAHASPGVCCPLACTPQPTPRLPPLYRKIKPPGWTSRTRWRCTRWACCARRGAGTCATTRTCCRGWGPKTWRWAYLWVGLALGCFAIECRGARRRELGQRRIKGRRRRRSPRALPPAPTNRTLPRPAPAPAAGLLPPPLLALPRGGLCERQHGRRGGGGVCAAPRGAAAGSVRAGGW